MEKGVAYQNKDIFFKILSENYKEKSFEAYGLNLPKIQQLLPTDLPKIMANDKRMDHLFLLEDGTLVIVDYESVYKKINKVKYLHYAARVLERYWNLEAEPIRLRILIIYTGDVEDAEETFHTDCVTLRTEQAFLVKIDGIQEMLLIQQKIQQKQKLSDYDIMKLMILPLTQKGSDKKQTMLNRVLELERV